MSQIFRSFAATVDDVNSQKREVVAKISAGEVDRYRTVITSRGVGLDAYRKNPIVLFEHGKSPVRGSVPIGRNVWIKADDNGTGRIIALTRFAEDDFSDLLFSFYKDGTMRGWSISVLPHESSAPTRAEIQSRSDMKDCELIYRKSELLEYSATSVPGLSSALSDPELRSLSTLVVRGFWTPTEEVEPLVAPIIERMNESGGLADGGALVDDGGEEDDASKKKKKKKPQADDADDESKDDEEDSEAERSMDVAEERQGFKSTEKRDEDGKWTEKPGSKKKKKDRTADDESEDADSDDDKDDDDGDDKDEDDAPKDKKKKKKRPDDSDDDDDDQVVKRDGFDPNEPRDSVGRWTSGADSDKNDVKRRKRKMDIEYGEPDENGVSRKQETPASRKRDDAMKRLQAVYDKNPLYVTPDLYDPKTGETLHGRVTKNAYHYGQREEKKYQYEIASDKSGVEDREEFNDLKKAVKALDRRHKDFIKEDKMKPTGAMRSMFDADSLSRSLIDEFGDDLSALREMIAAGEIDDVDVASPDPVVVEAAGPFAGLPPFVGRSFMDVYVRRSRLVGAWIEANQKMIRDFNEWRRGKG